MLWLSFVASVIIDKFLHMRSCLRTHQIHYRSRRVYLLHRFFIGCIVKNYDSALLWSKSHQLERKFSQRSLQLAMVSIRQIAEKIFGNSHDQQPETSKDKCDGLLRFGFGKFGKGESTKENSLKLLKIKNNLDFASSLLVLFRNKNSC